MGDKQGGAKLCKKELSSRNRSGFDYQQVFGKEACASPPKALGEEAQGPHPRKWQKSSVTHILSSSSTHVTNARRMGKMISPLRPYNPQAKMLLFFGKI